MDKLDATEIHARRLHAKEVTTPKNGEHFIFPIANGTVKLSGRDQVFRRSTSIHDHPARGEEYNDVLQGESDGSQPLVLVTDDSEARTFFGLSKGTAFIVITLNSLCRMKNHSQYHSHTLTLSGGRMLLESRADDYWNVVGVRDLSEAWTGNLDNASKLRRHEVQGNHEERRATSWSRPWNQPCFVRFRTSGTEKLVAKTNPTLADQDIHAAWKLTNLRESAWKRLNQEMMRIALLGRDSIR